MKCINLFEINVYINLRNRNKLRINKMSPTEKGIQPKAILKNEDMNG